MCIKSALAVLIWTVNVNKKPGDPFWAFGGFGSFLGPKAFRVPVLALFWGHFGAFFLWLILGPKLGPKGVQNLAFLAILGRSAYGDRLLGHHGLSATFLAFGQKGLRESVIFEKCWTDGGPTFSGPEAIEARGFLKTRFFESWKIPLKKSRLWVFGSRGLFWAPN